MEHREVGRGAGLALEQAFAGHELPEQDAEREDVRAAIDVLAVDLLR
jgi:hypothetical protein